MKLAFVGTFGLAPKSTLTARALPLGAALVRRGHQVTLIVPPWDNPADAGRCFDAAGVSVINLALPPRVPGLWYAELARRVVAATARLQPDVVHAFKPKGFAGVAAQWFLATRALTGRGPRVVMDTDDWEGWGGWNDVEPYAAWEKQVFARQEGWLLRHGDAVTTASLALTEMTAVARGSRSGVHYLPNGAAPPVEPPPERVAGLRTRLGLDGRSVVLCYTRFVEAGPEAFATALAPLAARDQRPAVLLVGRGLRGEEARCARLVRDAGLDLIDAGWVAPEWLPAHFRLATAALFPMVDTLINRTKCSAKLVDLLNAGVPVAASAVGQTAEYIVDGETGLLVAPGDWEALGAAAGRLLDDTAGGARMGAAAGARMAERYRWDGLAVVAEAAYQP